jgi:hypothetical protein
MTIGSQEDDDEQYCTGAGDEAGGVAGVAGEEAEGGRAHTESGVEGAGGSLSGTETDAEQDGGNAKRPRGLTSRRKRASTPAQLVVGFDNINDRAIRHGLVTIADLLQAR